MAINNPELAYINGQLKAWGYANRKCNYGIEFYLRDMSSPFVGESFEVDPECIISSFENQLVKIVKSGTPDHAGDLNLKYTPVEWEAVENSLLEWIFKYVNDSVGNRLEDPTNAFESTDSKFQRSVAHDLTEQIKSATQAHHILMVENSSDYFFGFVILFNSTSAFYELRIGSHF